MPCIVKKKKKDQQINKQPKQANKNKMHENARCLGNKICMDFIYEVLFFSILIVSFACFLFSFFFGGGWGGGGGGGAGSGGSQVYYCETLLFVHVCVCVCVCASVSVFACIKFVNGYLIFVFVYM